jgi:hypothetical protein
MAVAARESRRMFALDVRTLVWQKKKFDAERFVRTGKVSEYKAYPLPDTPAMRKALEEAYEEKKRQAGRG